MSKLQKILAVAMGMVLLAVSMAMAGEPVSNADELNAAFKNGGVYELTANIENTYKIESVAELTLDLNGFGITNTKNDGITMYDGGKLTVNDSKGEGYIKGYTPLRVQGGEGKKVDSTITLNNGTLLSTSWWGVVVTYNGATFNMNGGKITFADKSYDSVCLCGNGSKGAGGTIINITGGVLDGNIVDEALAIYHPQEGILNISGGRITGYDGIQFKGGTLNLTGGEITSTGAKPAGLDDNSNGSVKTGAAITFVSNKNYAGNMELNISGNPVIKAEKSYAVYEDTTVGDKKQTVKVNISGGTFTGFEIDGSTPKSLLFRNWDNIPAKSVTGGTYNSDPKAFVNAATHIIKEEAGKFTVTTIAGAPVDPVVPAETPAEEAAKNETVTATTPATNEEVEAAISGDIKVADLDKNEAGQVVVKAEVAAEAANSALTDKFVEAADVQPLPVFTAPVADASKVAMVTLNIKGSALGELTDPAKIVIIKILANKTGLKVAYADAIAGDMNGKFILQNADDNKIATAVDAAKEYKLSVFIKDNGDFDLDKTEGKILDPLAIVKKAADKPTPTPVDNGGTGGCSAGFAGIVLLALLPFVKREDK